VGHDDRAVAYVADDPPDLPSQESAPTLSLSDTPTLTHHIYLPSFRKATLPLTETLKTRYLLVEYWIHKHGDENCGPPVCVDFPAYSFHPSSGVLTVYRSNPALEKVDVGYVGSGVSIGGGLGGGVVSHLMTFATCPFTSSDIVLHAFDATGTVFLERADQAFTLTAGTEWISRTVAVYENPAAPDCTVTTTHRIANYAFQQRDKIEYHR
jgi:hypothetical protein